MKKTPQDDFDPQAFLARAGEGRTVLAYHNNETVFSQGDAADTVFYIQKNRVKVVVLSEQGKEAVVGILESAQFFGEACLSGNPLRIFTPTALEECVITAIAKTAMLAALRSEPKFPELFMSYLLKRNRRIEEDLIDQLFNSSEKRLARLLLLANFGKDDSQQPIKVSRQPGNIGGDDRHDPVAGQLLPEQVPNAGLIDRRSDLRPAHPRTEYPMTNKPSPSADKKSADKQHKGMMGDGTKEQNLNQPVTPGARIEKDQVTAAFEKKAPPKS